MQHSPALAKELALAQSAVEVMNSAKDIATFENAWKEYLHRIERCWYKAMAHYKKSPKWSGWHGKYAGLRTKDPLLCYLRQARGADEHSVQEIMLSTPNSIAINPPAGSNVLYIKSLTDNPQGGFSLDAPHGATVIFFPGKTELLPVTNQGTTFQPPTEHLGKAVNPGNVVEVARLGFAYYEEFLAKAQLEFVR